MHLLTQSALLKALGWTLFNSLWQMALLWTLYKVVTMLFRTASAHTRHGLALMFLGTGVIWSTATFFINYFFFSTQPEAGLWGRSLFTVGGNSGYIFFEACRQVISEILPYCSFLYLLVLAFLFIRYSNQYLRSRQLKEQGLSKIQPELRIFVEKTSRLMGIRKEVRIWLSSLVEGPVTLGFLKPVILIPVAMMSNLSPQQVEAILLHELAHIKRYDYLLHLGMTIIEILFFFNPFARWLIRELKKEREHRCDDLVIQFRYDPHIYVSALLSLASNGRAPQQQLALAAAGGSEKLLLQRVRRILRLREVKDRPGAKALIFFLLTLTGTFMLLSGSQSPESQIVVTASIKRSLPGEPMNNAPGQVSFLSIEQPMTILRIDPIEGTAPKKGASSPAPHKRSQSSSLEDQDEESETENNSMIAVRDKDAEDESRNGEFATIVQQDEREYSMGTSSDNTANIITVTPAISVKAIALRQPFVPNSSFSFQQIEDTSKLIEKYAYLQSLASHELAEAVKKMQKELQVQLKVLQATRSKEEQTALKAQKQILEEQLKLQEQFLRKQQELEKKLERAGKVRRIVYI